MRMLLRIIPAMPWEEIPLRGYKTILEKRLTNLTAKGNRRIEPMDTDVDFYCEEYIMNRKNRGLAVIINNKTFNKETRLQERTGSDEDYRAFKTRLKELGFYVEPNEMKYKNLTAAEMEKAMLEAAGINHLENDCFVCVILSYGKDGIVYGVDKSIEIKKLIAPFKGKNCETLVGKPKIFFVQACPILMQSTRESTDSDTTGYGRKESTPMPYKIQRIPTEADIFIAYSAIPGHLSWKGDSNGKSWFVQAISDVFKKNGQTADLMTLMTRVNKQLAYKIASSGLTDSLKMPCTTTMLTKDVYFRPK